MAFNMPVDPSGLYYGSNANNLVNVAADNAVFNEEVQAQTILCENLSVSGTTTVTNLQQVNLQAPILELAVGNTASDTTLSGITTTWKGPSQQLYGGLVRSPGPTDGVYHLVKDATTPGLTGSSPADLSVAQIYSSQLNATNQLLAGSATITNNIHAGSATIDNGLTATSYSVSPSSVLDSTHLAAPNIAYTGTVSGTHATLDDGSGKLSNVEVDTGHISYTGSVTGSHSTLDDGNGNMTVKGVQAHGIVYGLSYIVPQVNPVDHTTWVTIPSGITGIPDLVVPESVIDDGAGNLSNNSITTNSINLNGGGIENCDSIQCDGEIDAHELKVFGDIYVYPSVAFLGSLEDEVPTLEVTGEGVTCLKVQATDILATLNPLEIIPFLGDLTTQFAPYAQMTGTGNVNVWSVAGAGGTLKLSGPTIEDFLTDPEGTFLNGIPIIGDFSPKDYPYAEMTSSGNLTLHAGSYKIEPIPPLPIGESIAHGGGNFSADGTGYFGKDVTVDGNLTCNNVAKFIDTNLGKFTHPAIVTVVGNINQQLGNVTFGDIVLDLLSKMTVNMDQQINGNVNITGTLTCANMNLLNDAASSARSALTQVFFDVVQNIDPSNTSTQTGSSTTAQLPGDPAMTVMSFVNPSDLMAGTINTMTTSITIVRLAPSPSTITVTWLGGTATLTHDYSVTGTNVTLTQDMTMFTQSQLNPTPPLFQSANLFPTGVTLRVSDAVYGIGSAAATMTVNYELWRPLTKLNSGFETYNNVLDDSFGNATISGTLSVNGQNVTGVFGTTGGISLTSPAANQLLQYNGTNWVNTSNITVSNLYTTTGAFFQGAYPSSFPSSTAGGVILGALSGTGNGFIQGLTNVNSSSLSGTLTINPNGGTLNVASTLSMTGTNPVIRLKNSGVAPPSYSSLSAGMKIVTYDDGIYEYGLGIDSGTQWYIAGVQHKFYTLNGGTTPTIALSTNNKTVSTSSHTLDDGNGHCTFVATDGGGSQMQLSNNSGETSIRFNNGGASKYIVGYNSVNGMFIYDFINTSFWLYQGGSTKGQVKTMNSTLDDGSGNMTIAGTLTTSKVTIVSSASLPYQILASDSIIWFNSSNTTVSTLTLPASPVQGQLLIIICGAAPVIGTKTLVGGTMYYNGTSYTSLPLYPFTTLEMRYCGATTDSIWHVTGSNVSTSLILDNKISNFNLISQNAGWPINPKLSVTSNASQVDQWTFSNTNAVAVAAGVAMVVNDVTSITTRYAVGTGLASTIVFTGTLSATTGDTVTFVWNGLTTSTTVSAGSSAISFTWNLTAANVNTAFAAGTQVTAKGTALGITTCTGNMTMNFTNYYPVSTLTSGLSTTNQLGGNTLDDGRGNTNIRGILTAGSIGRTLYVGSVITLPYTVLPADVWIFVNGGSGALTLPAGDLGRILYIVIYNTVPTSISFAGNIRINGIQYPNPANITPVAHSLWMCTYMTGTTWNIMTNGYGTYAYGLTTPSYSLTNNASNASLVIPSLTTPLLSVTSNQSLAGTTAVNGTNSTAVASGVAMTVVTVSTVSANYAVGAGLASTILFTGTLSATTGSVVTFAWGTLSTTTTIASGSSAINFTWNLTAANINTAYVAASTVTATGTSLGISTCTAAMTINFTMYRPISKINSGLSSSLNTFDDGYGNTAISGNTSVTGALNINGGLVTHQNWVNPPYTVTTSDCYVYVNAGTSGTITLPTTAVQGQTFTITVSSAASGNCTIAASSIRYSGIAASTSVTLVPAASAVFVWLTTGIYAAYGDILIPAVTNLTDVSLTTLSNTQYLGWDTATSKWKNMSVPTTTPNSSYLLSGLGDVTLGTLSNNQVLTYSTGSSKWVNSATQLANCGDVAIASQTNTQYLGWDSASSKWKNLTLPAASSNTVAGLTDVALTTLSNGQYLAYNTGTSKWNNITFPTIPTNSSFNLDNLSNVSMTTKSSGQLLQWNGTAWVNWTLSQSLDTLSNVSMTTKSTNQYVGWNGTAWTNMSIPATTPNSSYNLNGLGDVTFTSLANGNYMSYNSATTKWNNIAPPTIPTNGSFALSGLSDVTITSAATSQLLQWNGTKWVNVSNLALGSGTINTTGFITTTNQVACGWLTAGVDNQAIALGSSSATNPYILWAAQNSNWELFTRGSASTSPSANNFIGFYNVNAGINLLTMDQTGKVAVPGTFGVTGATTLSTVGTSGLATLNSASVTTTLSVTGATTLSTLGTSGLATLNSASVTTTLGVTGTTTLSGSLLLNGGPTYALQDICFNTTTRRTIQPAGSNVGATSTDIQIASANGGTVWLNQDNAYPVRAHVNMLDNGAGNMTIGGTLNITPTGSNSNLYTLTANTGLGPYGTQYWSNIIAGGVYGGLRYNLGPNNYTLKTDGSAVQGSAMIMGVAGVDLYHFGATSTTDVTATPTQMQAYCAAQFSQPTTNLRSTATNVTGTLAVTGATTLTGTTTATKIQGSGTGTAYLNNLMNVYMQGSAWYVMTSGSTAALQVVDNATSGISRVITYNNVLDDGSGAMTVHTTLGVTGATTLSTVSTSGLATLNSASVTTTLGVTGALTASSTVTASGFMTLNGGIGFKQTTYSGSAGYTILNSDTWVWAAASSSGTLTLPTSPVTGQSVYISVSKTAGAITITGTSITIQCNSNSTASIALVAGTSMQLIYQGSSNWVASGVTSSLGYSITLPSITTTGLATFASATVSGTLGVTGNTTLSTLSTSGNATLNSLTVTTQLSINGGAIGKYYTDQLGVNWTGASFPLYGLGSNGLQTTLSSYYGVNLMIAGGGPVKTVNPTNSVILDDGGGNMSCPGNVKGATITSTSGGCFQGAWPSTFPNNTNGAVFMGCQGGTGRAFIQGVYGNNGSAPSSNSDLVIQPNGAFTVFGAGILRTTNGTWNSPLGGNSTFAYGMNWFGSTDYFNCNYNLPSPVIGAEVIAFCTQQPFNTANHIIAGSGVNIHGNGQTGGVDANAKYAFRFYSDGINWYY